MDNNDHDMLVELNSDMKHVRSGFEDMKRSHEANWKKTDIHSAILERHTNTLEFGKKLFWLLVTSLVGGSGLIGLIFWALKSPR